MGSRDLSCTCVRNLAKIGQSAVVSLCTCECDFGVISYKSRRGVDRGRRYIHIHNVHLIKFAYFSNYGTSYQK